MVRTNSRILLALVAGVMVALAGCATEDGEEATDGTNGTDGTDGTDGTNGTDGTDGTNDSDTVDDDNETGDGVTDDNLTGNDTGDTGNGTPGTGSNVTGNDTGATGDNVTGNATVSMVNTLNVTATNLSFDAPDNVTAGWTAINLTNNDTELHHLQLLAIGNNSWAEFQEAFQSAAEDPNASGPPPEWILMAGGPNAAEPGNSTVATVNLTEGTYAMVCFIPSPDGVPHAFKGMVKQLNVTAAENETMMPETNATLNMTDFNFTVSENLTAGTHEVNVTNAGNDTHEAMLVRLNGTASAMDYVNETAQGVPANGTQNGTAVGGLTYIEPNMTATVTLNLTEGRYAWICFAHIEQGMLHEFQVAAAEAETTATT